MTLEADPDLAKLKRLADKLRKRRHPKPVETEAGFQKAVTDYAKLHGWTVFSLPDSRRVTATGYPDLTLMHPTGPTPLVVAELKRYGQKPRADQRAWLAAFRAAGVPAFCWTPHSWLEIEYTLGNRA
jgi:hypothetical protein